MPPTDPPPLSGVRYAVRILVGTAIDWLVLDALGDPNPIWAMISTVIVLDPVLQTTLLNFKSRFAHTLVGSAIGFLLLVAVPRYPYAIIPLGMALASLVCTTVLSLPGNWKIAPVTAALVMAAGVTAHSETAGLTTALRRIGEVLFGSAVAVAVTGAAQLLARRAR
jgi:uncharacterized membrane protein YccC